MSEKLGSPPCALSEHVTSLLKFSQEIGGLSMMELAAVFRIAAATCDEVHAITEKAQMAIKIRGWVPGK